MLAPNGVGKTIQFYMIVVDWTQQWENISRSGRNNQICRYINRRHKKASVTLHQEASYSALDVEDNIRSILGNERHEQARTKRQT
jgi:ABC-type lipopolysaccharide export system ATPase subunit